MTRAVANQGDALTFSKLAKVQPCHVDTGINGVEGCSAGKGKQMDAATAEARRTALGDQAGMYLTFSLCGEEFGLEILKVREIIGFMDITAVPRTPKHVKGIINLRGKVISVVDLRLKFGMEEIEPTAESCIIVVSVDGVEIGIVVDKVCEVLDIDAAQIEDTPAFGTDIATDFILGMGKIGESVKILLDVEKVLVAAEAARIANVAECAQEEQEKQR